MKERTLLIGIRRPKATILEADASLAELVRLADTAGCEVVKVLKQDLKAINPSTFVGRGKVDVIGEILAGGLFDLVIFDDELSPAQNRNLSDKLGIKVLDRTSVILDIFARRARTREGELQVELAQLSYRLTRLTGRGLALSQQAGYIGNRGPGETKLEVDRRRIRDRLAFIRRNLLDVRRHRELHRRKREGVPIPVVSLVGYTNTGKSSLMNALTDASVFVEDKFFATLDPTIRKLRLKSGREILIADTVGFIRKLPHHLVEAFKATFEEVERSDLLLHVIDASEVECLYQASVVESVLHELRLSSKPCLKIYNKCDKAVLYARNTKEDVCVSALKKTGLDEMVNRMDFMLSHSFKHARMCLPHRKGRILSELYRVGRVTLVRHGRDGVVVDADLPQKLLGRYKKYCINSV